jgi:hypothetical protein
MSARVVRAARAIWEFVVGDDPLTALGVAVALGVTAVVASGHGDGWWVMPVAVAGLLVVSLRRRAP